MSLASGRAAAAIAGVLLLLSPAACGKKAPLRLADDRAPERAPALHARVREGRVILDFRVPPHRIFPEREEPWVLARVLRQAVPAAGVVEAGAILDAAGFGFDALLTWDEAAPSPGSSFVYRVEFRDAHRRRRAVSEPLAVSWDQLPGAPSGLTAAGGGRAVILAWSAPSGAAAGGRYRVYRREPPQEAREPVSPEPVGESRFVDSRVEPGRDYCYSVRSVLDARGLEIEGPASDEACARAADFEAPPARPPQAP